MPYVAKRRREGKPIVFAGELNANLPYMPGEAEIPRDDFDVLLEPATPPYDLFAPPKEPVSLADYAMALHAATLIKDGGTLQLGIGSFADALAHALILRHTPQRRVPRAARQARRSTIAGCRVSSRSAIGLYGCTEMLVDAFLALKRAGILKRRVTDGKAAAPRCMPASSSAARPSTANCARCRPIELADIAMTSISFTNTLDGDEALKREQRRDARFVNTAMVITLLGAASSDMLEDGRVVSGAGGQHDLVTMAQALDGARSIIAVRATRQPGSAHDLQHRLALRQRHRAAPPARHRRHRVRHRRFARQVRPRLHRRHAGDCRQPLPAGLRQEAQRAGKLEPKSTRARQAQARIRPSGLAEALGAARRDGLLPAFPLGTEMTEAEQSLAAALSDLKNAGYVELARMGLAGLPSAPSAGDAAALERMSLAAPSSLGDRALKSPRARRTAAATPLMGRWRKAQACGRAGSPVIGQPPDVARALALANRR